MCDKTCNTCLKTFRKNSNNFKLIHGKYFSNKCKKCVNKDNSNLNKQTYDKHKRRQKYLKNRKKYLEYCKEYRRKNKDKIKERYYLKQQEKGAKPKPRLLHTMFKLRGITSYLKQNVQHSALPYTIETLRKHLEDQFESWMNWNNLGKYSASKWDDNDPSTWTWQIDHIIPYADLPYTSPDDENFKKLWALENLRPLSAKKNVLDGARRTRHKSKQRTKVVFKAPPRKEKISEDIIKKVKDLYLNGDNRKQIAEKLNITMHLVRRIYKEHNITKYDRKISDKKVCKKCYKNKHLTYYRKRLKNNKYYYQSECKTCEKESSNNRSKNWFKNNYQDTEFKRKHLEKVRQWEENNKQYRRQYRKSKHQRKRLNDWMKNKRDKDPCFKLKNTISNIIKYSLKNNKETRKSKYYFDKLPFTLYELRKHIESQFEPWMNWNNWGGYDSENWNDNNPNTWTWKLSHINTNFYFKNVDDEGCQQYWDLNNLKPISAKYVK